MAKSFVLKQSLGFHINRLAAAMRTDFAARLDRHGVKVSEWAVLAAIRQGAQAPGDVSRMMAIDPGAVTRTVERLVEAGLIVRRPNDSDARSHTLKLTAKGTATLATLEQEAEATNRQFTSNLTPAELTKLVSFLDRIFEDRPVGG